MVTVVKQDKAWCPFCGGVPLMVPVLGVYSDYLEWCFVQCDECSAQGPPANTEPKAWQLWNTRNMERDEA